MRLSSGDRIAARPTPVAHKACRHLHPITALIVGGLLLLASGATALDRDKTSATETLGAMAEWTPAEDGDILGPVDPNTMNEPLLYRSVASHLDMRDDGYNAGYIFGMTRGVASSTMHPAVKPVFFLLTIPLDIVFLPFEVIGGFF